jgi:nitrogen fixation protein NifU and related proteins
VKNLYHDILLDHYAYPRNSGELTDATITSRQYNPSCGDAVVMTGKIVDDILVAVKFKATGCVITVAAASLLSESILAQSLTILASLEKEQLLMYLGVDLGPTRLKCALLPLYAVKDALATYQGLQK